MKVSTADRAQVAAYISGVKAAIESGLTEFVLLASLHRMCHRREDRSDQKIPGAPIGNGARLLAYLKTEAPQVYAKLIDGSGMPSSNRCL